MRSLYVSMTKPADTIEDGEYPAILSQIIQIGSHKFSKDGREWYSPQVILGFELPTLTYEKDGEIFSKIKSGTYFLSLNPSRNGQCGLREVLDGFRDGSDWTDEELEKFDMSSYLGKACLLGIAAVESKGRTYSNIVNVKNFPVESVIEKRRTPVFIVIDDFSNEPLISSLPSWIQDKIRASKEYQELQKNQGIPALPNDITDETLSFDAGKDGEEIRIEDVPF